MRRMVFTLIFTALFMAGGSITFSQESEKTKPSTSEEKMMMGQAMEGGMMGAKGMMMRPQGKMMMMSSMYGMMMGKYIVATKDGGVVVMVGNKLLKYDKNLELKKEVEIEIDMPNMQKMREKCFKMMEQGGMMRQPTGEPQAQSGSEESSEHQSHH